jgi:alkylhydroperoxidase family enzyme
MESDLLTDREKAAVLWAEHVTLNTARSRDDVFEIVRGRLNDLDPDKVHPIRLDHGDPLARGLPHPKG